MIERTYCCEGPNCETHQRTATAPPHLPASFIETRTRLSGKDYLHHFCCWDCLMKYAAAQPVPERIGWT